MGNFIILFLASFSFFVHLGTFGGRGVADHSFFGDFGVEWVSYGILQNCTAKRYLNWIVAIVDYVVLPYL